MRRWLWVGSLALAAAVATPAAACINSYSLEIKFLLQQGNRESALRKVAQLEEKFHTDKSVANTNDLAVARILFGRIDEGIALLEDLEKQHPGKAATAANLGTAFELAGNDQAALQWIREGIRRDPDEHRGTEWVHVRILEAKLAIKADANWLDTHSVMGLSFGDAPQPARPALPVDHLGQEHSLKDTSLAIAYQLFERTSLVNPKDRVVADLYMTRADLVLLMYAAERVPEGIKQARSAYEGALKYGDPRTALIASRLGELDRLERNPSAVKKP